MPRRYLKRNLPSPDKLKNNKLFSLLGCHMHDPELWHLHRFSVAKAFFNGIFWCAIPIPLQMLCAALTAVPLRANIPLSVVLVWISNPITMPFVFYANYMVGKLIIGGSYSSEFQLSLEWIWNKLGEIWLPLYVGSVVSGIIAGAIGYFAMLILWRYKVNKQWNDRKKRNRRH